MILNRALRLDAYETFSQSDQFLFSGTVSLGVSRGQVQDNSFPPWASRCRAGVLWLFMTLFMLCNCLSPTLSLRLLCFFSSLLFVHALSLALSLLNMLCFSIFLSVSHLMIPVFSSSLFALSLSRARSF